MTDDRYKEFLDDFGRRLRAASLNAHEANRDRGLRAAPRMSPWTALRRSPWAALRTRLLPRPLRLPFLVTAVLLTSATIALAASGVILTGSPVHTAGPSKPTVMFGIPAVGTSRLLPLRVADPEGGLPWGMRVTHTTRGYVCVQVGRVDHGRLGELGIDGAFHDDHRFHPLPASATPANLQLSQSTNIECDHVLHGTFAGASEGLESSAASNPTSETGSLSTRREISFGLLGPHAVAITYRTAAGTKTSKLLPDLGAYLIVQRAKPGQGVASDSATQGSDRRPIAPNGALTAISYRYGRSRCVSNGHGYQRMLHACGLSDEPPPKPKALPAVQEPIRVSFHIHDRLVDSAELTFRAPYAVTSAAQDYSASTFGCRDPKTKRPIETGGKSYERDVAAGGLVHLVISGSAFACAQSARITLSYSRELEGVPSFTPIGSRTVHIPRDTQAPRLH